MSTVASIKAWMKDGLSVDECKKNLFGKDADQIIAQAVAELEQERNAAQTAVAVMDHVPETEKVEAQPATETIEPLTHVEKESDEERQYEISRLEYWGRYWNKHAKNLPFPISELQKQQYVFND